MRRLLALLVTSLPFLAKVSSEHGGDEFKTWPVKAGAWVEQSHGKIWPAPKEQKSVEEFLVLRSNSFRFEVTPSPLIIFINRKAVFSKCTDSLVLVRWLL